MALAPVEQNASPLLRVVVEDGNRRTEMKCPHCEEWQDILAYKNPDLVRKYVEALNPIVKCVRCKHLFSPKWLA